MSILKRDQNASPVTARPRKRVRFNLEDDDTATNSEIVEVHQSPTLSAKQIALRRSVLATKELFLFDYGTPLTLDADTLATTMALKVDHSYSDVLDHPLTISQNKKRARSPPTNPPQEPAAKKAKITISSNPQMAVDPVANASDLNQTEIVIESVMDSVSASKPNRLSTTTTIALHSGATKSSANDLKLQRMRSIRNRKPEWFVTLCFSDWSVWCL